MSWAQGVGRSNRPAPTKPFIFSIVLASSERRGRRRASASGAVDRLIGIDKAGVVDRSMGNIQPFWLAVSTFSTTFTCRVCPRLIGKVVDLGFRLRQSIKHLFEWRLLPAVLLHKIQNSVDNRKRKLEGHCANVYAFLATQSWQTSSGYGF